MHGSQRSPLTGCNCWDGRSFLCHLLHGDITETERDAFLPVNDQYPHSTRYRLRMDSGTSQEPLSDTLLGYILKNWKILTLHKAWPQYKWGGPKKKNKKKTTASKWHTSFCQKQGRDSEFPMFSPSWPSVRIWISGTHAACVFLFPPYLLFPSVSLYQISQTTPT